jgi:AAA+ ATPase superfamily predicted ATPase
MNKNLPFVGRKQELAQLESKNKNPGAQLVVIRGRRRIGKSRLVKEFAKNKSLLTFEGLFPDEGINAQQQREHFSTQLEQQLGTPKLAANNWSDLFFSLTNLTKGKNVIILFDEITWMADKDPTFLPKLKVAWDEHFKQNNSMMLILCGSISSWIDKNILNSSGFLGRITQRITLNQLALNEMKELMVRRGTKGSSIELLNAFAITGGVPWYIELFQSKSSINDSIKQLCFTADGILANEFQQIFNDLFKNRSPIYHKIVISVSNRKLTQSEIAEKINYSNGTQLGSYLNDLETAGFIARDEIWSFKTALSKKQVQFRLKDSYLRFYLKYIEPRKNRISKGDFEGENGADIPNFSSIMGLQFENLVLNNRMLIINNLGLTRNDIVFDNPYFQNATKQINACQIDYLIQTRTNTLYLCEIKFSKNEIGKQIIPELKTKIKSLKMPKQFTCLPVLIHVSGISEELENSEYFYKTVDFSQFLN